MPWTEIFNDYKKIEKGEWSTKGFLIQLDNGKRIEIGLYKEPDDNEEYSNTYTLQIFLNDDVVLCELAGKEVKQ